jgi:transcriptional regulator with XRE-family HTH domain
MSLSDETYATLQDDESADLEDAINEAIGHRLREERRRLGLTLQDVAGRSGMSLGMISKIENAQTSPSLRTLARLSHALEVPVTTFFRGFEEERDASYVRAGEGIELARLGTRHGHRYELLAAAKGAQRRVQPFLVTLTEQRETFPLFQHDGVEFLYVLEGSFVYRYGRQTYEMQPGDSLMFDGHVAHGPEGLDELPARFLSITVELDAEERDTDR